MQSQLTSLQVLLVRVPLSAKIGRFSFSASVTRQSSTTGEAVLSYTREESGPRYFLRKEVIFTLFPVDTVT